MLSRIWCDSKYLLPGLTDRKYYQTPIELHPTRKHDPSADTLDGNNTISEHHIKHWADEEFGHYGMNHLNLLLEQFTELIRNSMPTIDDQLCKNEFKHTPRTKTDLQDVTRVVSV